MYNIIYLSKTKDMEVQLPLLIFPPGDSEIKFYFFLKYVS